MNLSYGSRGDDVKKLQGALGINADGIFGSQTQEAVRRYQQKNGLDVDGIVGEKTWGSIQKGGNVSTQPVVSTMSTGSSGYESQMQKKYTPSQAVQDAYNHLQQVASGKPGEYQSQWQDTINDLYGQITGRQPFSYDAAKDPLYQQYRALYTQQGKNAMMDTMGQAAGLTGGYGSTYSQNVGQQAYDQYLQRLNEVVPELADRAYSRYKDEGDQLYQRYQMAQANEGRDYDRYRDQVGDWRSERDYAKGLYDSEYDRDYGQYSDDMSRIYQLYQMAYQRERDKIADEQWERQFQAAQAARSGGGGGYSSGGSGKSEKLTYGKPATGKNKESSTTVQVRGEQNVTASDAVAMVNSGRYRYAGVDKNGNPILERTSQWNKPGRNINMTR